MKQLTHILIALGSLITLLVSCEEFYKPDIDVVYGTLVVESHITNDQGKNYVMVSKTRSYYANSSVEWASGATVELVQDNFKIIQAREDVPGYYIFPSTPVPGNKYRLRITYLKEVYESDYAVMPPIPVIDTLYTQNVNAQIIKINGYGVAETFNRPAREIYIDAPATPEMKYYRFSCRAILQWKTTPLGRYDSTMHYTPEDTLKRAAIGGGDDPIVRDPHDNWSHVLYGWKAQLDKDLYNLAGPKEFSTAQKIFKHPIISLKYDCIQYLDSALQIPKNWILIIDQYGISKESYDFHEKLNQQFSAAGSLFDPVLTQIYGNIHCKTDPSKMALGFFDLMSYDQHRYYLNMGNGEDKTVVLRRIGRDRYFDISDYGYNKDTPPIFWETDYK